MLFLLIAGVAAAVIAVAYRAWNQRPGQEPAPNAAQLSIQTDHRDRGDAQLQQLQEMLAQAQADGARFAPIVNAAHQLVERYPDNPAGHLFLAQLLLMEQQPQQAYEHLCQSLKLDPAQPEVELLAGTTALSLDLVDQAGHHYAQAVGLDPSNPKYRLHLAQVYIRQGKYQLARKDLLGVIRRDSSQHAAYACLADLYARQNKLALALTQIEKAIQQTPTTERDKVIDYLLIKSQLLRRDNHPDDALLLLGQLTPKEQSKPQVIEAKALCWAMLGQPAKAAELYEQALLEQPANATFAAAAARWRIKAGDRSAAAGHLNTVRKINPRAPEIPELEQDLNR